MALPEGQPAPEPQPYAIQMVEDDMMAEIQRLGQEAQQPQEGDGAMEQEAEIRENAPEAPQGPALGEGQILAEVRPQLEAASVLQWFRSRRVQPNAFYSGAINRILVHLGSDGFVEIPEQTVPQ